MQEANLYLFGAGIGGCLIAILHGVLQQRLIIRPLLQRNSLENALPDTTLKLIVALLHFSTFAWLAGGVALILVSKLGNEAQTAIGLLVASLYIFASAANFWATRGRHPGWILLALAVIAILAGLF
ncbi:MAG: hypothetical protein HKM91_04595 [Altererythrobacter sp.]|nr:hypothetical protein [Altererythrobacter sp.]NNF93858.1 hypothetical protein [Altererythrobacter sp.]